MDSQDKNLTDEEKNHIAIEIENIVDDFLDPDNLTFETHTALRANQEGYVLAGDGKILFTSYDDYKKGMEATFKNIQKFIEVDAYNSHVYVLSKEAATCTTEFKSKYINADGDTVIHNGCWTFVFKKFENDWKVIHENGTHTQ